MFLDESFLANTNNVWPDDLTQPLHQACAKVIPRLVPPSQDWTPHNAFMLLFPLVSRLMTRVLLGPELWDDDGWHQVANLYFQAGSAASTHVRDTYPSWLRWTSRYLDKDVKTVYAARRQGQAILKSVIEARLAEIDHGVGGPGLRSGFSDGLGWLVESYLAEKKPVDPNNIMQDTAFLLAASVPSTTHTALSILLDLVDVDNADALAKIREEISLRYAEHGSWTRQSLGSLRLLDSFMKESQRIHNLQYSSYQPFCFQVTPQSVIGKKLMFLLRHDAAHGPRRLHLKRRPPHPRRHTHCHAQPAAGT